MGIIFNYPYHIVSHAGRGNCLKVRGNNTISNNTKVCMWAWKDEPAQLWKVSAPASGNKILSGISDTYAINYTCGDEPNFPSDCDVWFEAENEDTFVEFYIVNLTNNIFRIGLRDYDLFLTAPDVDNDTTVRWEEWTGNTSQMWRLCTENDFTYAKGIDTAATLSNSVLDIMSNNDLSFVCRYLRRTVNSSWGLQPAERDLIHNHGLDIVCFFQYNANAVTEFTTETATLDANAALADAAALNIPENAAIYFAVDYDALPIDIETAIVPYFETINQIFSNASTRYRIGVYGSGSVCKAIKEIHQLASLSFLCGSSAYQGTASYNSLPRFDVRQNAPQQMLAGVYVDYDETWQADFGQW